MTDRSVDEMSEEELDETLPDVSKRKKNNKAGKDGGRKINEAIEENSMTR